VDGRSRPGVAILAVLPLAALLAGAPVAGQGPQLHGRIYREAVKALAPGKLLVAARGLPDPNFSKTVVLLAAYSDEGALGLIVNRRSETPLSRLFPHVAPTVTSAAPAFTGGPVERTVAMALLRGPEPPKGARHVVDGVHVVSGREALDALIASGAAADRLRVYVGYAGWGPGQLAAETGQGSWYVLDGDADVVFDADPATVWPRQIVRTEGLNARRGQPSPSAW
jgi:putative transcriptional regulator